MLAKFMRRRLQGLNRLEKEEVALKWKKRLSITYMLIGWNLLTFTMYHFFSSRFPSIDKNSDNVERYQSILDFENVKEAKVIRFQGFSRIGEYDLLNKNVVNEETIDNKNVR